MIRVLFVDHGEALGGAEYCLVSLLEHLDRARFWPILACSEGPLADAGRRIEVLVRTLEMPRLRGELAALPRLWRGLRRLRAIIAADGADLVYSNTMRASFYAALAARWCRRPLLWHVHDIYPRGVYVRWMSRLVQAAIAVSAAAAAPLPGRLPVDVAPNGVDLPRFDAQVTDGSAARREWGVPDSAPLVVSCRGSEKEIADETRTSINTRLSPTVVRAKKQRVFRDGRGNKKQSSRYWCYLG